MSLSVPELTRFDSAPACHAAVAVLIRDCLQAAIERQGYATLALPGGTTPVGFFRLLVQPPLLGAVRWSQVSFFWGDERLVPPDHPASNYGMARAHLLRHLPITDQQVFRMPGEIEPAVVAARRYQEVMAKAFAALAGPRQAQGAGNYPRFDLILLGMGRDGHTASLFPDHPVLTSTDWVAAVAVAPVVPAVGRLTLTLPVINNADMVCMVATGTEKVRLAESLAVAPPQSCYPASLVRPRGRLLWYVAP